MGERHQDQARGEGVRWDARKWGRGLVAEGGLEGEGTLRSFEQSGRFDRAWRMLAATYHRDVHLPENVVDIRSRRPR